MAGFTGAPPIVTDGLIFAVDAANYESYTSGSDTWYDLVNNYSGSFENTPVFNSEKAGVLSFDGSDDAILFPSDSNYRLSTTMTFSFIFKFSNVGTGQTLMIRGPQSENGFYWFMLYQTRPYFQCRRLDDSNYQGFTGGNSLNENTWYMWDTVINNTSIIMYVNGEHYQSFSTSGIGTDTYDSSIYIGRYALGGYSTWYYAGDIAYEAIYNRALTSTEITQNYNALKSRFNL